MNVISQMKACWKAYCNVILRLSRRISSCQMTASEESQIAVICQDEILRLSLRMHYNTLSNKLSPEKLRSSHGSVNIKA